MAGTVDPKLSPQKPPPQLRQELRLFPAEPDADGSAAWTLHDPLTNRHFRLGQLEVDLLLFFNQGNDEEKIAQLSSLKLGHQVTAAEVSELFEFLRRNNLTTADEMQKLWYRQQQAMIGNQSFLSQLIKSYLFFRIPLLKPDRFLTRTLKYVDWLGTRSSLVGLSLLFFLGLFLTLRQMDSFIKTFLHFFNPEGFGAYLLALAFVKIFHELGHGYTAKKMGCKVPIIGVAFLVGWPVLYTDTSDAWKLNSRSKRLKIGAAGIAVELSIAIVSLFCWSLAPEGIMRSVFFLLATTTWVMSILVNCNPLMRFDGYYLLSDWLRIPNLDARSGALARWLMREKLFALNHPPPEPPQKTMLIFAYSVWIYRFFLYIGIAAVVYYFFFKVLGLILFAVEVVYFILRPFYNEFKEWYKLWPEMSWNKTTIRSSLILLVILGLGFIPWRSAINAPAFIKARYTPLYTQVSGQITKIAVANNDKVSKGQVLITMANPELSYEKQQVQSRYDELSWQRASLGFDEKMRSEALIVASALFTQNQRLRGLWKKEEKLTITAPETGIVADFSQDIKVGDWLAEGSQVLAVLKENDLTVVAYIEEAYLSRLKPGVKGRFYPEKGHFPPLEVEVMEIDSIAIKSLDALYSASLFGGDVAVRKNNQDELIPVISTYQLKLKLLNKPEKLERVMRGTAVLEGAPESFFMRLKNQVYAVLRRESGF